MLVLLFGNCYHFLKIFFFFLIIVFAILFNHDSFEMESFLINIISMVCNL